MIQLCDSIAYNKYVLDRILCPQSLAILYILHMESIVNKKFIMISTLEGMRKRSKPAALVDYFERLVLLFNNSILHDRDGQWNLPMEGGKIEAMSFPNRSAYKVVKNIELLFDLVFERHSSRCQRRDMFKVCIIENCQAIMDNLR